MRRTVVGLGVVGSVLVGLGVVQLLPSGTPLAVQPARAAALVAYDSCEALLADVRADLVETAGPYGWGGDVGWREIASAESGAPVPQAASPDGASDAVGSGPTGTNLQEQDVDEPDVAKLTGDRLVTVTAGALQVVRTGATPRLLVRLALPSPTGAGAELNLLDAELLVDRDRVLVLSRGWRQGGPNAPGTATTTLDLADLSDPSAPRWVDRWSVDGDEVSARLSAGAVRLVTRTHPTPVPVEITRPYGLEQEAAATTANREAAGRMTLAQVLPQARRTPTGGATRARAAVGCDQVNVAPDATGGGLLLVTTLEPSRGLSPTDAVAVVADGDLVYASKDRLVVATSRWGTGGAWRGRPWPAGPGRGPVEPVTTTLHSFATTDRTSTRYVASGEVPGFLLGRWALSYDAGHLRAVTTEQPATAPVEPRPVDPILVDPGPDSPVTSGDIAPAPVDPSVSTLTVLAEDGQRLVRTGTVTGLGRGEQVQAVRFFGDLATVVTFRQTDPLYVLDLSDPTSPSVTGELKVTGFSTYLHPIGGDLLLGLGREADEQGRQLGMQASVFDLSDRARPTQLSRVQMGEAYSPAESDSRAFTYDPARRQVLLLAETASADHLPSTSVRALAVSAKGEVTASARTEMRRIAAYGGRVVVDGDRVLVVGPDQVVALAADGLTPTGTLGLA